MSVFKKKVLILLWFSFLLIPKVYYLIESHNLGYYENLNIFHRGDESHYLQIGKNLVEYGVYTDNDSKIPSESAIWRPPIWPLILSVFYLITNNVFFMILLKSLLEITCLLVVILILKKKFNFSIYQLMPFVILLVEPQYLKYSITFLSESITAMFLLLFIISFIVFIDNKNKRIFIVFLGALVILCHPVSIFFVGLLLLFYGLINLKTYTRQILFHTLLFFFLVALWPIRNQLVFNKGICLTASQGAVFSKGWNREVTLNFNNVNGDLADETLNLRDFPPKIQTSNETSILDRSELYNESTLRFLKSLTLKEKVEIAILKLKANFNPFPMIDKATFIDRIAVPFRIFYLFIFIQVLYLLIVRRNLTKEIFYCCLVVLAIILGQSLMAIYTYTGLRFNSIYGLSILFIGILLNFKYLNSKMISLFKKEHI